MGESQLETRTDRVRGSGTDREAGSEREGPNAGEGEGHGRRRLGPFFFLCVSEHGVILTWRRTRGSLNSVREEARESQRLKKPDRQKETKKNLEKGTAGTRQQKTSHCRSFKSRGGNLK